MFSSVLVGMLVEVIVEKDRVRKGLVIVGGVGEHHVEIKVGLEVLIILFDFTFRGHLRKVKDFAPANLSNHFFHRFEVFEGVVDREAFYRNIRIVWGSLTMDGIHDIWSHTQAIV